MKSGSFFDAKKHRKNTNFNGFSWLDTALTGGQPNYIVFKMPLPTHCAILRAHPTRKINFSCKIFFKKKFIKIFHLVKLFFIIFFKKIFHKNLKSHVGCEKIISVEKKSRQDGEKWREDERLFFFAKNNSN